jgi:hypothetical protein
MALNRAFSYIRSLVGIQGADGSTRVSNSNPLPISDADGSITVDGSVSVNNFPVNQVISGTVGVQGFDGTNKASNNNPVPVFDDYYSAEYLPDQTNTNPTSSVLTFSFSSPVQLVWVFMRGASINDEGRVTVGVDSGTTDGTPVPGVTDPVVQTPSQNTGTVLQDQTPTPITVVANSVKVFAPVGARVTVYGYRR